MSPPLDDGQLSSERPPTGDRIWGAACHIGVLFLSFLAPLVAMLTKGKRSPFVRQHAVESLNCQVAIFGALLLSLLLGALISSIWPGLATSYERVIGPAIFVYQACLVVQILIATVEAGRGDTYRYRLTLPLVK